MHLQEGFTHDSFATNGSEDFVDRMVSYIENGAEYARQQDDGDEMDSVWDMLGLDGASTLLTSSALALTTLALAY